MTTAPDTREDNAEPTTARRFDVVGLLMKPFRRPSDGAILAEGIVCRECVQVYRLPDGTERRELVTRQAVLDTARTIARAPMTLGHPSGGFVTKDNADRFVTGDVDGETYVEEGHQGSFARVKVALRRKDAIDAYEDGSAIELSPGYEVTLDETGGDHPVFGRYDAAQVARDCNHNAQVHKGRGVDVGLRADSADAVQISSWQPPEPTTKTPAGDVRVDKEEEVYMKSDLVRVLALLGVARTDNEDVALAQAVPAAEKLRADFEFAEKKATDMEAKVADMEVEIEASPDFEALKLQNEELAKSIEAITGERDGLKADVEKKAADALALEELKAAQELLKKELETITGERDAMKADMEVAAKDKQDRADAAELKGWQRVADKHDVRHDGLDLPTLRRALAKKRFDGLPDDASEDYLNGLLATMRTDKAPKPSGSAYSGNKVRVDAEPKPDARQDEDDEFRNPSRDHAKQTRADAMGGAR